MNDSNQNPLNGYNTDPETEKMEAVPGTQPEIKKPEAPQAQTSCTAPAQGAGTCAYQSEDTAPYRSQMNHTVYTAGASSAQSAAPYGDSAYRDAGAENPVSQSGSGAEKMDGYQANPAASPQPSLNSQGNPGSSYQANGNSYTWGSTGISQTGTVPQYTQPVYQQKTKKEKKRGKRLGVKIVAAVLACLLVSFGSVGAFVLLIQNGVVAVNDSSGSGKAAFTIHKVIADESLEASKLNAAVSQKTPQNIAESLIPSVVCIQNYQATSPNNLFGGNFGGGNRYGSNGNETEDTILPVDPTSQGSGIVYSEDGYVITNAHVISGASKIKVITSNGNTYEAEVVGADTLTDLAVIKIINTEDQFTPAEFGSAEDLKVADAVMAIGNPGGIEFNSTVTMGYVSALDREVSDESTGFSMKCIQTDAAINPGNSGGALVNMYGHVVGINSSKIVATGYEGLGFAIPINTAQPIISDLMKYGYVKDRAMLGISGTYVDSMTAQFYGLSAGFYVAQLNSEAAQSSGLKEGDVITAVDGTEVTSSTTLSSFLMTKKPNDSVKLSVSRAETSETLTIDLVLTENVGG